MTSLCPCRPDLALSQGTDTSELEGDGGLQGKSSPLGSPQSSCPTSTPEFPGETLVPLAIPGRRLLPMNSWCLRMEQKHSLK